MLDRAKYISWVGHGGAGLAPPAKFTGARSYAFVAQADSEAIQALVDTLLAPATGGVVSYTSIGGACLVSFMDIAKCTAEHQHLGWTTGRECAIWTPLLEHRQGHLLPRLVLWAPYIWIDYSLGLVVGREVWGWQKFGGDIVMADDQPALAAAFNCQTMIFDTLTTESQGRKATLLEVQGQKPIGEDEAVWTHIEHFLSEVSGPLLGAALERMAGELVQPILPAIALKQFPDSEHPEWACYQAIVNTPCRLTHMTAGGLLDDRFTLKVTHCESHPILTDLFGRSARPGDVVELPVLWGGWLNFDFEALPGSRIAP